MARGERQTTPGRLGKSRRLCSCQDFSVRLRIEHCFLGGGESVNVPTNVSRTRVASPAQQRASSEVSCYILVACAARRSRSPLNCLQQVFTTMAGVSARLEDAHQEGRQANFDRNSAIPGWTAGRRERDGRQSLAWREDWSHEVSLLASFTCCWTHCF